LHIENPNRTIKLDDGSICVCEVPWYADFYEDWYISEYPARYIADIPFWDLYAMTDTEILDYCLEQDRIADAEEIARNQMIDTATQAEIDRRMEERSPPVFVTSDTVIVGGCLCADGKI
jgi:hypothetical protein